jgi:AraC-like DNA-binding protein
MSGISEGFGIFCAATGVRELQICAHIDEDLVGFDLSTGLAQSRLKISGQKNARRSGCDMLLLPRGSTLDISSEGGIRSVTLIGRRSAFAELLSGGYADTLRSVETNGPLAFAGTPLSHALRTIAEDVLTTSLDPLIAPLFLRAKTAELVWQIACHLHAMARQPRQPEALPERSRQGLEKVRHIIGENPERPLTIEQLGRAAGMNRTKLRALFKTVYGITISEYRFTLVMKRAEQLLQANDLTVAEVGYRLGYSEPSSFNTAYRRYFGRPPGQSRQCASL